MNPEVTAAIIAAAVSALTLIGTLAAQYLGRRATKGDTRHSMEEQREQLDRTFSEQRRQLEIRLSEQRTQLDRTLAEQRTRTLNERFATAAEQLGSEKPAVRLAGVYAMAGLADDWKENRQTCVDVLCAYLRMPYEPDPGQAAPEPQRLAFQAIREVRHTVIRVITAHLREGASTSWQGLDLDFTGVVFDGGDFIGARFSGGTVSFKYAQFSSGTVNFASAHFSGGYVDFIGARFSGSTVYFRLAWCSGATVDFSDAEFSGGTVDFWGARFFSGATVDFTSARFSGGTVDFCGAQFSGDVVDFHGARFCGSRVTFRSALFHGDVSFSDAQFSRGMVNFTGTRFSGGTARFYDAEFSGGEVDFSNAADWTCPPAFSWRDTPPSGVKLPRKEDQSQA